MDLTSSLGSFNINQTSATNNKNNNKNTNNSNKKNKKNVYYMNIDVENGMCQGVYFKHNVALKCNNHAKYLKDGMFALCENHKNQKIAH